MINEINTEVDRILTENGGISKSQLMELEDKLSQYVESVDFDYKQYKPVQTRVNGIRAAMGTTDYMTATTAAADPSYGSSEGVYKVDSTGKRRVAGGTKCFFCEPYRTRPVAPCICKDIY